MKESKSLRCFVDTNVFLYGFISQDQKKKEIAKSLLKKNEVVVSTQIINEVLANIFKKGDKSQFSEEKAMKLIASFYRKYEVVELDKKLMKEACILRKVYQFSFWDGLIVSAALRSTCKILYSEDMHDGLEVEGVLKIVNPFKEEK